MERINYRITLDAHKNGIQRMLQGFETADKISRRISISLVSGGDTFELPCDHVVALMYVTTPGATNPSIHSCEIEGDTINYDVLPIVEEGVTEMQLKLIQTGMDGAKTVLCAPRIAVEVTYSNVDDETAEQTPEFTALEDAIAKAHEVYNSRLIRIGFGKDMTFVAEYADGTVYEYNGFKEIFYEGNVLLAESYAHGGTGVRAGEDTDNSKYFSNVSRSASEDSKIVAAEARGLLEETQEKTIFTLFEVDFASGCLMYISHNYAFDVNEETGYLDVYSPHNYKPKEIVSEVVAEYMLPVVTHDGNGHVTIKAGGIGGSSGSNKRISEITLLADAWVEESEEKYSQVVAIDGVTENSQVDIKLTDEQFVIFRKKELAFTTRNIGGVVTVFAIGQRPTNDYTMQVTISEVYDA